MMIVPAPAEKECPVCFKKADERALKCVECGNWFDSRWRRFDTFSRLLGPIPALITATTALVAVVTWASVLLEKKSPSISLSIGPLLSNDDNTVVASISNIGNGKALIDSTIWCLLGNIDTTSQTEIPVALFGSAKPIVVSTDELIAAEFQLISNSSPMVFGSPEEARNAWTDANGQTMEKYACRYSYRNVRGEVSLGYTPPQPSLASVDPATAGSP